MRSTRVTDVVVIGGGVIGCAVAYWLTELGRTDVLLLERHVLAGGETGICPGGIRQQFDREADCLLARRSVAFYENIAERLGSEHPFSFERSGYLFAAHDAATLDRYRRNVEMQNRLEIPSIMLGAREVNELLPELDVGDLLGASFCAEDGFLEDCHGVTFALAAAARRRGVQVLVHAEVLSIRDAADGWEVATTRGTYRAHHVVIAAGSASRELAEPFGLSLPITSVKRRLVFTEPAPGRHLDPLLVASDRGVAVKQLRSGVFYLGWLAETDAADDLTFIEQSLDAGARLLPVLGDLGVQRVMRGMYDLTPDRRPILGPAPGFPGIHVAAGFSGHGFMIAPAVGELVARLLCEVECPLPAAAFSLERFDQRAAPESLYI